jgi:AcrR family transcriptional regulator
MSRPRKVSDEDVLAATYRAMSRLGPGELTLVEIAKEAGITAGAIVQRFGSKRDLLLALADGAAASTEDHLAALGGRYSAALDALRAYADGFARMAASPAAFARSLAYLQIDLTDADFRKRLVRQARATRSGIERLLKRAVAGGELQRNTDTTRLTRTIEAVLAGSMMTWAFYRKGTAAQWLRTDLDAVLAPHVNA